MRHFRNEIFQDGGCCHTWSTSSTVCTLLFFVLVSLVATAESQDVSRALVRLQAICDGKPRSGTGFVVALRNDTAFIATSQHVVVGCDVIRTTFAAAPTVKRGAGVFQMDVATDLAVLQVEDPPSGVDYLPVSGRVVEPRSEADAERVTPGRRLRPRIFGNEH